VENHKYLLVLLSNPQADLPKQDALPGDAPKEKSTRKKRGSR
jgi:hypothetical protein